MKKYFILLMSLLIIPISVNAASATISLEANNTKVKTGDNMKVVPYALLMMAAAGGYVTVCRRNKEN
mgnify:CR=1 FL=1